MKKSWKITVVFVIFIGLLFNVITINHNKEVNKIKTDKKVVMLTFDDGPSSYADNKIMDILDHFDVKVTFFMTGINLQKYKSDIGIKKVVDRMIKSGHSLGNHSYFHNKYINYQKKLINELDGVNLMIQNIYLENGIKIDKKDIPIRMPYLQYYKGLGYVIQRIKNPFWIRGYLGTDYLEQVTGKDKILNQYIKHLKKGQIFVAHSKDYAKVWLPELIQNLKAKKYNFANFTQNERFHYSNYGKLVF
ncbi:peptidoglycan-N-acetylglucosamine deacetylase [Entomoplasma ellychniae]|uniref:Peptidoglycan-N-acetylglucosamine deacetylase n=1 Tax=Entomoplasma ellychniae TaxID=2114 RepID=A0A8E2QVX1_9MOLU|nr:polysaccharide deacetylase family protein [Entomoplasma ellychniae]PPE04661.1 peptidoglycan-N-acetylglucosamine deacetylase [Entomoplasma ellychniae]